MSTFPNLGVWLVALVAFGPLALLAGFDARLLSKTGEPAGRWVQAWARRYPVLAFLMVLVLGMLVGHFFWSTPPPCPAATTVVTAADRDCVPGASHRT